MPTYDYTCTICGEQIEIFHSMKEVARTLCPSCGKEGLKRMISAGAGIIFKGSGFYETDYKRAGSSEGKEEGKEEKKGDKGGKGETVMKSEKQSECKCKGEREK